MRDMDTATLNHGGNEVACRTPEPGSVVKINRRDALVTRVVGIRVFFRYHTARGWSQTERNIIWGGTE